jgi:hypothetical protein
MAHDGVQMLYPREEAFLRSEPVDGRSCVVCQLRIDESDSATLFCVARTGGFPLGYVYCAGREGVSQCMLAKPRMSGMGLALPRYLSDHLRPGHRAEWVKAPLLRDCGHLVHSRCFEESQAHEEVGASMRNPAGRFGRRGGGVSHACACCGKALNLRSL